MEYPYHVKNCILDIGMLNSPLIENPRNGSRVHVFSSPAGSKSMQDGWGDKEGSVAASRHSSWEDEEEGGGMWNSTGSQGSGSSWGQGSNGGWGQSHAGKKPSNKVGCLIKQKYKKYLLKIQITQHLWPATFI